MGEGSLYSLRSTLTLKLLIKTLDRSSTINRTSYPTWKPPRNYGSNLVSVYEQWILHALLTRLLSGVLRVLNHNSDVRYLTPPKPTQNPSPYVYCIITFYLDPSNISPFIQIFKDTIYRPIANEPECFLLEVLQSEEEPGVVTVVQGFAESREWFSEVQAKRAYFGPYLEKTNPMHIRPRKFFKY